MIKSNIRISIIIPCYNAEKFIERTFKCLDTQTYRNFEVICINDGSTDGTQQLLEKLCEERQNCAVYSYSNRGVSCVRNIGLEKAKGDYIHFLDADDWFYPSMYERMVKMILDNDMPDAVRVGYKWVYNFDEKNIPSQYFVMENDFIIEGNENIIDHFAKHTIGISEKDVTDYYKSGIMPWNAEFIPVWIFLYKRSSLEENNLRFTKEITMGEDRIFNVKFFAFANKIVYTNSIYYLYVNNSGGAVSTMCKDPRKMCEDKVRYYIEREKLRQFFLKEKNLDIFHSYRGSNVLACLQLVMTLVNLAYKEGKNMFLEFVNNNLIRESLQGFPTKGAPLKFKIPLLMLQNNMAGLMFNAVWLMSKCGIRFKHL